MFAIVCVLTIIGGLVGCASAAAESKGSEKAATLGFATMWVCLLSAFWLLYALVFH